jgi:hypothetical protein
MEKVIVFRRMKAYYPSECPNAVGYLKDCANAIAS